MQGRTKFNRVVGAYILSPLEEGSKDPVQNYGFKVSYLTSGESVRVTSYSIRNSTELASSDSRPTVQLSNSRRDSGVLSNVLSKAAADQNEVTSFIALKALPIDPARARRTTGSFEETADDLSWAKTCKEAVDMMVNTIYQACKDAGSAHENFVSEEDVVRWADMYPGTFTTINFYHRIAWRKLSAQPP